MMMIILIRVIRGVEIYFMIMIIFRVIREVKIYFTIHDIIQSDQGSINLFFEDLDAVYDTSVGKLSESGGLEENLVRNASHL